jgi:hypothetical protein
MRKLAEAVAIVVLLLGAVTADAHTCPNRWPHTGSMWYDGENYLDYQFVWHSLPNWHFYPNAFEMNTSFEWSFAEGCSAWTDLPEGYDDCSTAGTSEQDPMVWAAGFGSYNAWAIQHNRTYYGSMWLALTWNAYGSSFGTYAQELWNNCRIWGYPDSPWCIGINDEGDGRGLTGGYMYRWGPELFSWDTVSCWEP